MPDSTQYEYEERAFLSEDQFLAIKQKLDELSVSRQSDNKVSYFFVLPTVNVSIAASSHKTVIKYKGGQLGIGNGFEEYEVPIKGASLREAIGLLTALLGQEPQVSEQFRLNYQLPDGIEVALKYTHTWGFHLEAERTYRHSDALEKHKQQAKRDLDQLAQRLGIAYINDDTMATSKDAWAAGEQFGEYTPETFRTKYGQLFS